MNIRTFLSFLAWSTLVLGGLLSFFCNTGWLNPSIAPNLSLLSPEIGPMSRNHEIEVDPAVLGDLPPERFSFQNIAGPSGQEGRLYIAYYRRARRWTGRPHDLDVCYRAMGFEELEVQSWQTMDGASVWSRIFRRGDRTVHVVHWLQKPGVTPGPETLIQRMERLLSPQGLRQDIASVYFEFDIEEAPKKTEFLEAAQTIMEELENLWN